MKVRHPTFELVDTTWLDNQLKHLNLVPDNVAKALNDYEAVLRRTLGPTDRLRKAIEEAFQPARHLAWQREHVDTPIISVSAIEQAIQNAQGAWARQMDPVRSAIDSFQASLRSGLGLDQTGLARLAESIAPAMATSTHLEHLLRLATETAKYEQLFSELPTFDQIAFDDAAVIIDEERIEIADAVAALDNGADGASLVDRLEAMKRNNPKTYVVLCSCSPSSSIRFGTGTCRNEPTPTLRAQRRLPAR